MAEQYILQQKLEESYYRIANYHRRLGEFFGKTRKKQPPRLVTLASECNNARAMIFPNPAFYNHKKWSIANSLFWFSFLNMSYAYEPQNHCVVITPEQLLKDVCEPNEMHEATHSVIYPKDGLIKKNPEELASLPGYLKELLDISLKEIKYEKIFPFKEYKKISMQTAEFFAPIGVTYLSGSFEEHDFGEYIHNLECLPDYLNNLSLKRDRVYGLLNHLPQFAGEIMVGQYKGDVRALMREHPQLVRLPGPQLWDQYCFPLLTQGRLG